MFSKSFQKVLPSSFLRIAIYRLYSQISAAASVKRHEPAAAGVILYLSEQVKCRAVSCNMKIELVFYIPTCLSARLACLAGISRLNIGGIYSSAGTVRFSTGLSIVLHQVSKSITSMRHPACCLRVTTSALMVSPPSSIHVDFGEAYYIMHFSQPLLHSPSLTAPYSQPFTDSSILTALH